MLDLRPHTVLDKSFGPKVEVVRKQWSGNNNNNNKKKKKKGVIGGIGMVWGLSRASMPAQELSACGS